MLINLIGPDGYDVYCTLKFTDEKDRDDVTKLIEKFNDHFGTKVNTTLLRFKFFSRNQEPGECIDEYVTALRLVSQKCQFEHLEDSLLRDRVVCGVTDSSVRDRLIQTDELTLEKAARICQASEMSNDDGCEIEGVKSDTPTCDGARVDAVWRSLGARRSGISGHGRIGGHRAVPRAAVRGSMPRRVETARRKAQRDLWARADRRTSRRQRPAGSGGTSCWARWWASCGTSRSARMHFMRSIILRR